MLLLDIAAAAAAGEMLLVFTIQLKTPVFIIISMFVSPSLNIMQTDIKSWLNLPSILNSYIRLVFIIFSINYHYESTNNVYNRTDYVVLP